jgi:hypothetical protein
MSDSENWPHVVEGPDGWSRTGDQFVKHVTDRGTSEYYILTDRPTRSPINKMNGEPIYFDRTRELVIRTVEGERVLYGCAHCDYVREVMGAIRPHLKRHNAPKEPRKSAAPRAPEMSLGDALKQLGDIDAMRERELVWRERALKAERELARVKRAFKSLGE